jgi:hypothetical protein
MLLPLLDHNPTNSASQVAIDVGHDTQLLTIFTVGKKKNPNSTLTLR